MKAVTIAKRAQCVALWIATAISMTSCSSGDGGTPPATQSTLAVSITGDGRVVSTPAGIDCSASNGTTTGMCNAQFASGITVTLQAAAAAGQVLTQWSGSCSGASSCTVTLDASHNVGVQFAIVQRTLTLTIGTPAYDDGILMMTFVGPLIVNIRPNAGIEIVARETTLPSGDLQTALIASGALQSGAIAEIDVRGGPATGLVTGAVVQAAANASGNYVRRTSLAAYTVFAVP